MRELKLEEIHEANYELLKAVDKLCKKIGVTYYLAYGTLLGAVRHKNFIPWDDDVDIWMKRDDYTKLFDYMSYHKEELYPIYFCSRIYTKNYEYGINRITNLMYKYVDTRTHIESQYGIFIDVYPLDAVADSYNKFRKLYKRVDHLNTMYILYLQDKSYSGNFVGGLIKRIANRMLLVIFKSQTNIANYIEKKTNEIISNNYKKDCDYLCVVVWWGYMKIHEKEIFDDTVAVTINNYEFPAPKEYDKLLREIYGDYMKLPPKEERVPYHGYKIYELN